MANAFFEIREPENETYLSYAPGTPEREALRKEIERMKNTEVEIKPVIGGQKIGTDKQQDVVMPHNHQHKLGSVHLCGEKEVKMAIEASRDRSEERRVGKECRERRTRRQ